MISECRRIFEYLSDDMSKFIFQNRILYSCTADKRKIQDIVLYSVENGRRINDLMKSSNKVCVFGAGTWGREIAEIWNEEIAFFVDNDKEKAGKTICGIHIFLPEEKLDSNFDGIVIIATRLFYEKIYGQIISMGIKEECIINVGKMLDELSHKQYFDLGDNLLIFKNEIFVDAGCFDGNTTLDFIRWCNNDFCKIFCFEPDENNLKKVRDRFKSIPQNKVKIVDKGLWSKKGELGFNICGNGTSSFVLKSETSSPYNTVNVTTIDEQLYNEEVTFIKMDIEGAELEAIKGAKETIKKYKPKLAISVYHKPEDIILLPDVLLNYNSEYKLFLRHYSFAAAETVLYAI